MFLFFLLVAVLDGLTKVSLCTFHHSLYRAHVTRIRFFPFDTLANVVLLAKFWYVLEWHVISRKMEMAESDERLEFRSSTTKNIITPLPQCLRTPNLVGGWEKLPPINTNDLSIMWSCEVTSQNKKVNFFFTNPMAIKLRRVMTSWRRSRT